MATAQVDTLFFPGPEYKSSKPGFKWLKDGVQGSGSYILFSPAEKFGGARPGYAFKGGPIGLGYYLDQPLEVGKVLDDEDRRSEPAHDPSIPFIDVPEIEGDYPEDDDDEGNEAAAGEDHSDGMDTMAVESVCMACEEDGMTRLMRVVVPFFGEMMVSSFRCDHCGYRDTTTQPISDIMPQGAHLELEVDSLESLNRKVVTTKYTTITFPKLELEIPPGTSAGGRLTTVEGLVQEATVKLHESNKYRKSQLAILDSEEARLKGEGKDIDATLKARGTQEKKVAAVIDSIVASLVSFAMGKELPFTLVLDDPAGQAAIENPMAPGLDPKCKVTAYDRTPEQDKRVGVQVQQNAAAKYDETEEAATTKTPKPELTKKVKFTDHEISKMFYSAHDKDARFTTPCGQCGGRGENRMVVTKIPNFSEIILMCFVCEECGYKDAEVKPGGSIAKKGHITTLTATAETATEDLKRDVLKSGDASIAVPEIGFESGFGTLGAVYTTVEGLLTQTRDNVSGCNSFTTGDSSTPGIRGKMEKFIRSLNDIIDGKKPFTLIIHDPIGASWIYSKLKPEPDPQITIKHYERSVEENEMLGLNQMDTAECDAAEDTTVTSNDTETLISMSTLYT